MKKFLSTTVAFALILGLVPAIIADAAQTTDPNHWSNEAVQHAIDRGYFTGDENGNVAPDKDMTRAEFTTMVTRMQGIQPFGVSPFSDVEDGAWYRPYIAAAYYKNIITGLSETTFAPNAIINRQEAMTILSRAWNMSTTSTIVLTYKDASAIADWALPHVRSLTQSENIKGDDNGNFNPSNPITFGELSQVVYNKYRANHRGGIVTPAPTPGATAAPSLVSVKDEDSLKDALLAGKDVEVAEALTLTGTVIVENANTLTLDAAVSLDPGASLSIEGSLLVSNGATLNVGSGSVALANNSKVTLESNSTISFNSGSSFDAAGGSIEIYPNAKVITDADTTPVTIFGPTGLFNITGGKATLNASGNTPSATAYELSLNGNVTLSANALTLISSLTAGGVTIAEGSVITLDGFDMASDTPPALDANLDINIERGARIISAGKTYEYDGVSWDEIV